MRKACRRVGMQGMPLAMQCRRVCILASRDNGEAIGGVLDGPANVARRKH
jgi:hypothetical protein